MLFGQIALKKEWITSQQLEHALDVQKKKRGWLIGEILCFLNYMEESQVQEILGEQNFAVEKTGHVQFGRYRIIGEIGRGGMGRVFKAHDPQLDREVALKVLRYGEGASDKDIERFLREAKTTAKLRHPNIVALYDIGNEDDQNFFIMDFISGVSLKRFVQNYSLTISQIVSIMIKVAEAIGYAHSCGVIHRDLKPSNIMLTENREPKVMDFGLAKISAHESISKTGDVLGTPAYMSPEQAKSEIIDKRTDIYSLGVTLYELLGGRPPFVGSSYLDVLYQVVHHEPTPLRSLTSQVSPILDAICLKCLEKNPRKRYQDAAELIADLQNFLDNKPVLAKLSKWRYVKKFLYSKKTLLVMIFLLMVVVIGLAITVIRQREMITYYQQMIKEK
ncbi:serine/threonine protein kinase [Candidatus Uabimicrobium amorphum]|uniref:non-specific serine/threonine protein kinase n=1 Tax=Uabimicrobium amorphum TaxID=2596890 RepID=A0A5S9IP32_UABAM|nr:serine/threonine-protein kinase [Candidatus Uabimicrobium amorphum]BBM85077.1 serine/threonine protein kinase [Candidatus Uabimicrobium amorphum]